MASPTTVTFPNTSSGATTKAVVPNAQSTNTPAAYSGGASGSWDAPVVPPVTATPAKTATPPAVITAKPAVQNVQTQTQAVMNKTTDAQKQAEANAAAKNAADLARVTSGGMDQNQLAAKIKQMDIETYAKSSAGGKVSADGKLISYDGGDSWAVNPVSSSTPTSSSSTAPTGTNTSGTQNTQASSTGTVPPPSSSSDSQTPEQRARLAIQASDVAAQTAFDEHQSKINQIINGTYPLTEDQSATLQNIGNQFKSLIESQKLANANYEQSLRVAGISSGRSMYAPEVELGNIKGAMDEGVAKIADIDMKMQSALLQARQAIKDEDVQLLDMSYDNLTKFEAEKRKSITDLYNISTKEIENARQTYKDAQTEADSYAALSKSPDTFSPDFFSKLDDQRKKTGLPSYDGYSADIYKLQYDAAVKKTATEDAKTNAEKVAAETKRALDLISIFDKTGMKGDIKVGDHTYSYQGTNTADISSGTETDSTGKLRAWTFNKATGEAKSYDLGITTGSKNTTIKGDDGLYYSYDPLTQTAKPIYISDGRSAWDNGPLATGQTGPALPGHEENAGQCGAMVNALYGKGVIGDDLKTGKMDVLSPYKVEFSATNSANIQAGMTFVQAIGGKNGHIGIVESVGKDPVSGRAFITTFDSNRNSDGKIQHGKVVYLDDPTLKMIADHPTPNLPAFGPDAPPKQLGTGATTAEDNELLSPTEIKILGVPYGTTKGQAAKMGLKPVGAESTELSDKQIKAVESSPEGKQLIALKDLKNKISAYKGVITNLDSFAAVGANAAKVDALYAAAQIAWKEAAALGALTGPDMDLIYKALKPMSGVTNYASYKAGGGKEGVIASLDAGLETLNTSGSTKSKTLLSKYGEFKEDPYILNLTEDFTTPSEVPEVTPPPPALPPNFATVLQSERKNGVPDSTSLKNILSIYPAYAAEVEAARKNKHSDTDILNALIK